MSILCALFCIFLLAPAAWAEELPVASEIREHLLKLYPQQSRLIRQLRLTDASIQSELKQIDPYARFVTAEKTVGQPLAGIGARLFQTGGRWWLLPLEGGPLWNQGIRLRSQLAAVNDQPVTAGQPEQELADLIRGEAGTLVCLDLVLPDGKAAPVCVSRAVYQAPPVEVLDAGRWRILTFTSHATRSFLQQLLVSATPEKNREITLDLRECTGGDLYEALDAAALFLPPGRRMARLREYPEKKPQWVRVPAALPTYRIALRLQVGSRTASACEVFAGILQFQGAARLEGENTYGKCLSQGVYHLTDGSRLLLTNMKIEFPDGSSCQDVGLSPNQ